MTDAENQPTYSPAPRYLQFIATAVGFLVSTYFVSTILFNIGGPEQTMSAGFRWAIGGAALLFVIVMVIILGFTREGGFRAWRIEGGTLFLLKYEGGPVIVKLELSAVDSAQAQGVISARPDADDVPQERERPVVLIRAQGHSYKLHAANADQARELAAKLSQKGSGTISANDDRN
ncbi:MAG: hypothetical protein IT462_02720 [Planctomycetes bacterium]|nr:hypothetical protein [Planctomycetota bacterium]